MAGTGIAGVGTAERRRVEAVVETLAAIHHHGESLAELAHDARNMVTALGLYCDLLDEPGVLTPAHRHYASELRLLAEASRCLVEKLSLLDTEQADDPSHPRSGSCLQGRLFAETAETSPFGALSLERMDGCLIDDFREELLASRGLLAAIPGPSIRLAMRTDGGAWPVRMSGENLVRAMVNLVKNSAESIPGAGSIELRLSEQRDSDGAVRSLVLCLEDTGSGIDAGMLEKIFEPGFSTRAGSPAAGGWLCGHRGMGLSITRSIVDAAGGRIHAENRKPRGTRFVIELPVRDC
jgi:signal transduction histidine kinase